MQGELLLPRYKTMCGALQAGLGVRRGSYQHSIDVIANVCQSMREKHAASMGSRAGSEEYPYPQLRELMSAAQDGSVPSGRDV